MGNARGIRAEMALAFESTWGTTPASGFILMPFVTSGLGRSRGLVEDDLLGLGRDPQAPILDVVDVSGDVTVPVDLNTLGHWLRLLLGDAATTGTGPYTHVFSSGGTAALPSASIETAWPDASLYEMCAGVKANMLNLQMARGAGQKFTATVGLMGKSGTDAASSDAGTPTEAVFERFAHTSGTISRNDTALGNVVSCSLTYSNGLDPLEVIGETGEIGALDEGKASCTGELVVRLENGTLRAQAEAGTAMDLDLAWTIGANKTLAVAVPRVFLASPKVGVPGPGGIDVTYSFQAAQQANGDPMLTATLVNAVASYGAA